MGNLSTFEKLLIVLAMVIVGSLLVVTCNNCTKYHQSQPTSTTQTTVQVQQPPYQDYGNYQVVNTGPDQIVIVRDDWSGTEFYLTYALWQSLGGYNGALGYYRSHRYDPNWSVQQNEYRSSSSTTINNYYGQSQSGKTVDPAKPLGEQIKYEPSKGFTVKPKQTTVEPAPTESYTGEKSSGFGKQYGEPNQPATVRESTPYQPSAGFRTTPSTNTSTGYQPSKGFTTPKSTAPTDYKPSKGFSTPKTNTQSQPSDYKPSKGFSTPNKQPSTTSSPRNTSVSTPSKGFTTKKQ